MTVAEALARARRRLHDTGSDSARLDAELLLAQVLDCERGRLYAIDDRLLGTDAQAQYTALVERRAAGEPVAYLLGRRGFWTFELAVSPAVLVPRPETELLVEWALDCFAAGRPGRIADLGTGSGAIAIALAGERPQAQVTAVDRSADALAVARHNADRLGLDAPRLRCVHGDWYTGLDGRYELIVSNPPYIAADDAHLPALAHEPREALTDGGDGLACLRTIVAGAPQALVAGGWLLVEHGYDQGEAVRALFAQAGFGSIQTRRDLGGRERATGGRFDA